MRNTEPTPGRSKRCVALHDPVKQLACAIEIAPDSDDAIMTTAAAGLRVRPNWADTEMSAPES